MSKTQLRWQGQPVSLALTVGAAGLHYARFPIGAERVIVFSDTDVQITYEMQTVAAGAGAPTTPGALLTGAVSPGTVNATAGNRILQANVGQIIESNVPFNQLAMRVSGACAMYFEAGGAAGD